MVKFFFAVVSKLEDYSFDSLPIKLKEFIITNFGGVDFTSEPYQFKIKYYEKEMGSPLFKFFLSLKEIRESSIIIDFKKMCMQEEANAKRKINLDPGYITLNSVVLSTRKEAAHRIYLRDGIYLDLHLIYESSIYKPLPWTYPDYKNEGVLSFFYKMRNSFKKERNLNRKML